MRDYGVRVNRQGIDFRLDNRRRDPKGEPIYVPLRVGVYGRRQRGPITGQSPGSARRLEMLAANVATPLTTLLTLTYRENPREGESDEERNRRVAKRSKADLNRFLTCVRAELGEYLWVQEFQERGVVHYHLLSEHAISERRARLAWCRVSEALHDPSALRYAVKVEPIANPLGARSYVGRYMGKERQKRLPKGVAGAGRWWGRSNGLALALVMEVVSCQERALEGNYVEERVARHLRRYLSRRFRRKFRGGFFVDWGGQLCEALATMTPVLRDWFVQELDERMKVAARRVREAEASGYDVVPEGHREVGREERDGNALVHQLDVDPAAFERSRARWVKFWRRELRPRRGMFADYFPVFERSGGSGDNGGSGEPGGPAEELRLDLGPAADRRESYPE